MSPAQRIVIQNIPAPKELDLYTYILINHYTHGNDTTAISNVIQKLLQGYAFSVELFGII